MLQIYDSTSMSEKDYFGIRTKGGRRKENMKMTTFFKVQNAVTESVTLSKFMHTQVDNAI